MRWLRLFKREPKQQPNMMLTSVFSQGMHRYDNAWW